MYNQVFKIKNQNKKALKKYWSLKIQSHLDTIIFVVKETKRIN